MTKDTRADGWADAVAQERVGGGNFRGRRAVPSYADVKNLAARVLRRPHPRVGALRAQIAVLEERNSLLRERQRRLRARTTTLQRELEELAHRTPVMAMPVATAVAEIRGVSRLELRRKCVLEGSPPNPRILEIGAAHNPILPRRNGFQTRIADYLDREGLVEKYKSFTQYNADDIEDVDYVISPGAALDLAIPEQFDLVVASHVLEHTTSLIHFINECTRLLAPDGVLALVIPDHRYCFDRFRERTAISRVIDASYEKAGVHSAGTIIEWRLNATRHRGTTSWVPGHQGMYSFVSDAKGARAMAQAARDTDSYIDVHNWVFSPNHCRLLFDDLFALGFLQLRETFFHDTVRHEFFINLSQNGSGSGLTRAELVTLADNERRSLDPPEFEPATQHPLE